jgi:hypothetical protein
MKTMIFLKMDKGKMVYKMLKSSNNTGTNKSIPNFRETIPLQPSTQCTKTAGMARAVLGQISRFFHYRDKKTYCSLHM